MTGMTPTDIGLITQAAEVRCSPDGNQVAFTVVSVDLEVNDYRSRIWVAPVDGASEPYPFTAGEGRDLLPRWSPDGRRLAFVIRRDKRTDPNGYPSPPPGSEIVVLPVTVGGQAVRVAVMADEVSELEWSPDGSRLAFVARDRKESRYGTMEKPMAEREMPPRRLDHLFFRLDTVGWTVDRPTRLFVVTADGSQRPRPLTTGPFEVSGITWAPDSRQLAFVSARHEQWDLDLANDLWRVHLDAGDPVRLTNTTAIVSHPAWSADGQRLAYLWAPTPLNQPRHTQMAVHDLATGDQVELTSSLDRTCAPFGATRSPVWAGEHVLFAVEDAGNVNVYQVHSDGRGKPESLVGGERTVSSWDWAAGTLAFVASTPVTLAEVFVETTGRQLTSFTEAFTAGVGLSAPERFLATSPDGTEVECWAIPPVGAEAGARYPTLLNIHGGPYTQYGNKFFDEFQIQAGAGFGVLYCNPRGSSGYSEAWARAIRWPEAEPDPGSGWGGVDFDDVMACVAEAERSFAWIDPARLGVLGGSYGGYLTSWIVGHSARFQAACSERSCNNLLTLEQHSDIATEFRTYVGKTHLEAPDIYLRHSPVTYAEQITTPVLILHSEQDLRCPINQAEELFVALRLLGRQPVMVRFPGESHELSRSGSPRHRVMRAGCILDWFTQRLVQAGDPTFQR
jgi:dipeptidyl aminopeptidase/acylaminoacyl peptidase